MYHCLVINLVSSRLGDKFDRLMTLGKLLDNNAQLFILYLMFYEHLVQLGKESSSVIRSRSVTVKNWCNVLSMEGVTVCGHHPECRVTFRRGTDHKTSLETISNVPSHIPAREAYWKASPPSE